METDRMRLLTGRMPEFVAFLERRVGDRAAAEDIAQDALVRVMDRIESLPDDESLRAFFYRVLRNAAIDHLRRRGASDRAMARLASEFERAEMPDEPMKGAVCRCIGRLADELKPEYAEIIRRVDVDGLAVRDFAEEAAITQSNAGVRLHRARAALRKSVLSTCGNCAGEGCVDCDCAHG